MQEGGLSVLPHPVRWEEVSSPYRPPLSPLSLGLAQGIQDPTTPRVHGVDGGGGQSQDQAEVNYDPICPPVPRGVRGGGVWGLSPVRRKNSSPPLGDGVRGGWVILICGPPD